MGCLSACRHLGRGRNVASAGAMWSAHLTVPEFLDPCIATAMSGDRYFLRNIVVPNIINRIL
jgi:hypothetical protein